MTQFLLNLQFSLWHTFQKNNGILEQYPVITFYEHEKVGPLPKCNARLDVVKIFTNMIYELPNENRNPPPLQISFLAQL